jgi:outer membrane receptor protein involved in Fe transport
MDSTRTVELGGKIILRTVSSDYLIEADSLDGRGLVAVPERSNEFRYDQDVYAGYASYGFAMGRKLTAKLGARMEYTRINGDFITNNLRLQTDYSNFIPSALLAYDLGENQKLKFSYTRRLLRPSIYYLNPYINTSDRRNISAGNPTLDPELTDAYEIGYNTFINKSAITLTGYWRQTNNAIESLARLVPGSQLLPTDDTTRVLFTTYQNLARNATYGVSAFGSTKLTPKWNLSSNIDVYYMRLTSPALNLSNGGAMYNINFNSGWQLEKGWSLQMTGLFRSRRVELQGRAAGYRTYNIAVRKELFDKKGSLTVGVNNLFNRQLVFRNDFATDRFEFASDSYFYNRTVRVAFNYRFGKLENRPARPKKSISNDDQKAGG